MAARKRYRTTIADYERWFRSACAYLHWAYDGQQPVPDVLATLRDDIVALTDPKRAPDLKCPDYALYRLDVLDPPPKVRRSRRCKQRPKCPDIPRARSRRKAAAK
jgi:hypothetical protein